MKRFLQESFRLSSIAGWLAVGAGLFAGGCGNAGDRVVSQRPILYETAEEKEAAEAAASPSAAAVQPPKADEEAAAPAPAGKAPTAKTETKAQSETDAVDSPADRSPGAKKVAGAIASGGNAPKAKANSSDNSDNEEDDEPSKPIKLTWRDKRPDDVALWKPADYIDALADNDPRMLEAVVRLGTVAEGSDETARLLTRLLEPDESLFGKRLKTSTNDDADEEEQQQVRRNQELGKAVVGSLAANGTETADQTLKQLLMGKFKSDFQDKTLALAALGALANHPSQRHESMLYTVLTTPEAVRPEGRGQVTAGQLRAECLKVVSPIISDTMRTAVARHLIKPSTPEPDRLALLKLIESPVANNLEAQVILYASDQTRSQTRNKLQGYLGAYAAELMDTLLDTRGDGEGRRRRLGGVQFREAGLNHEEMAVVGRALWSTHLPAAVALRLPVISDYGQEESFLQLACCLPSPEVRAPLQSAVENRWLEGTGAFDGGKAIDSIRDPGALLVMKYAPRDQDPEEYRLEGARNTKRRPNDANKNPVRAQNLERMKKENEARYAWLDVTEVMVRSLNARFLQAAALRGKRALSAENEAILSSSGQERPAGAGDPFEANGLSDDASQVDATDSQPEVAFDPARGRERMPIALHDGAVVTSEYHLLWPDDLPASLASLKIAPLEVHYVRMDVDDRFAKLHGFYQRQLKERKDPNVWRTEKGIWIENLSTDATTGLAQSVDVMISRYAEQAVASRDVNEKLAVELLVVIAPDPRRPATAQQDVAAAKDPP
jgi:hypothetical protein